MTQKAIANQSGALPEEIVLALRQLIRRARTALVVRGLCLVGAVALGSVLAVMAVDAGFTLFSPWSRWMLSGAAYLAILAAAAWFIARPLARSYTLAGMARIIEARHPEMQERISSVVEILTSQDSPELRGSEALIQALTREAVRDAMIVKPKQEVTMRRVTPFMVTMSVLLAIFLGLLVMLPRQTAFLLARAAVPFANLPNVFATDLKVSPGDVVVAEGSGVRILVNVSNRRIASAKLRRSIPGGTELVEEMEITANAPGQDRAFAVAYPGVKSTFRYRVHAGDALSRYYTITVVPPPAVADVDLAFKYPEYSGLSPRVEKDSGGVIRALPGTVVDVAARINKPVKSAEVVIASSSGSQTVPAVVARGEDDRLVCRFRFDITAGLAGLWSIKLTDEFGLTNPKSERTIQAVADLAPAISVLHLRQRDLRLNPTEVLPVFFSAEDDYGLNDVSLALDVDGARSERRVAGPVPGQKPGRKIEGQTALDLNEAVFKNARKIAFHLKARDNMPPLFRGPQVGISPTFTITVDGNVKPFDEQVLDGQEQALRQELRRAQQELEAAQKVVPPLAEALGAEKTITPAASKQLDDMATSLAAAEKAVRNASDQVADSFYGELGRKLDNLADEHINKAAILAEQVRLTDKPEDRRKTVKAAEGEVDTSLAAVQDALRELDKVAPAVRRAVELSNLSERQDKLAEAKTAPEFPGTNAAARAAEQRDAQDKLADELSRLVKTTPGATNATVDAMRERAAAAAEDAERLAREQRAVAEETGRIAAIQKADKALRDLAREQADLAAQVRTNALAADQFEPMKQAAEAIGAQAIEKAVADQQAVVAALSNKAEDLMHPLPPEEKQKEAQKIADLDRRQEELRNRVVDQIEERKQALQQLAAEQAKLAEEARPVPDAAPQAAAMTRAADALKAEQPRQAIAQQEEIARALKAAEDKLLHPPPPAEQQQDLRKLADLEKKQDELKRKIGALAEARNKALQDLSGEQEKLAAEARSDPAAVPQARVMRRAADALREDEPGKAIADQDSAAKKLVEAAERVVRETPLTAEQKQAQKLADLARSQDNLQKKLQDLAAQRAKAFQDLAAEQTKLAAEARENPASAPQSEPMARAAETLKAGQPRQAAAQQVEVEKALKAAKQALLNPLPGAQQRQDAQKLAELQKRQEEIKKQADDLAAQHKKALQDLAAEQAKLAAAAAAEQPAAPSAKPMDRAASELRKDQPGNAMADQQAAAKALAEAADKLGKTQKAMPQQQPQAQKLADLAKKQDDLSKRVADAMAQNDKELKKLADQQKQLAEDAKAAPPAAAQAEKLAQAADALRAGKPETAEVSQNAALKGLKAAEKNLQTAKPDLQQQKAAQALADMARRQEALRKKGDALAEQRDKALRALADEQAKLAKAAKAEAPAAPQAADAMKRAAEQIKTDQPGKAAADQQAASKALAEAAAKLPGPQTATPEQKQAGKLADLAKRQNDLQKKVADLADQQNKAMQNLAGEQNKLADEARAAPATADQAQKLARAAEAIKTKKPQAAMDRQDSALKELKAAQDAIKAATQPTPTQQQEAQKLAALEKKQGALRDKVQALSEQKAQALGKLADAQEKLAAEARANPRTAPQADEMKRAAEAARSDQPRQALPRQDAVDKALDNATAQLKQSPPPTARQQEQAQAIQDFARKQDELRKKAAALAQQAGKELGDIAAEQARLATEAKATPAASDQAEKMAKAAEAIMVGQSEKALPMQQSAEDALKDALRKLEHPKLTADQEERADRLAELAGKQGELRKATSQAAEDAAKELARLAAQQEKLAARTRVNPLTVQQADPMMRAAGALRTERPDSAPAAQEEAEKALAAKAEQVKQTPSATPQKRQQAQEALDLAKQQAALRKEVDAALQKQAQNMARLAEAEQQLADAAKSEPSTVGQAQTMQRAADELKTGQTARTIGDQTIAEKALAQAARQAATPQASPQQQAEAQKTGDLLNRQEALRQKLADLGARGEGSYSARKNEQVGQLQAQQAEVAKAASQLADDVKAEHPQEKKSVAAAAKAAESAAGQLARNNLSEAGRSAKQAGAELGQVAKELQNAAQAEMAKAPPDTQEPARKLMALAERADDLAGRQEQLNHEIQALATDKPVTELMEKQQNLSEKAADFLQKANILREQAQDLGLPSLAQQQANQVADQANRALQDANKATQMLRDLNRPPQTDTPPEPMPAAAQQAIQQAQASSAQALTTAGKMLDNVSDTLAQLQPLAPLPPAETPVVPEAYEEARQAAETQTPLAALQAAAALRQAAAKTAAQAQAMGANPKPASQQLMAAAGTGKNPTAPVEGEAQEWNYKTGMKLRNWLHLKGDLKDEVLQASPDEGPEEYRGLIKSYFREVSRRGGNEQ